MKSKIVITFCAAAVGCVLAAVWSIHIYNTQQDVNYYNKARVILADDIIAVNDGRYDDIDHNFYIINNNGLVIWSDVEDIITGGVVDISEQIQNDHFFDNNNHGMVKLVFAINGNNGIKGFAICVIDKTLVQSDARILRIIKVFLPLFLWGIIMLILMVWKGRYVWNRILSPIDSLTESSIAIIKGNYEISERKNALNGTAVGDLAYQFELMRDELKTKREREEQMKKSQKELLSCMSHDLRTPITTIKAHAEAIRDGLAETQERRTKYINTIIYKTGVVSKMISDLLDHSNAELNQLSVDRKEVYVKDYLDNLIKELEIYCLHSNCRFISNNKVPEMLVLMDSSRITQVIFNLVENAVKYIDKENKIVQFKAYIRSGRMYISVRDNGPGISMTDIPYVFDRFYRTEKSRSTQIPGAGLGLSICKYIVEVHDGEISLESKTGEGSEFTFYITTGLS